MRSLAAGALAALFLVACGQGTTGGAVSNSPTSSPSRSSPAALAKLSCAGQVSAPHSMAIFRLPGTPAVVEILDVSNPLKPSLACTLSPAQGARFVSGTKLVFWVADELGSADLVSGVVTRTARIPAVAGTGAFSADATKFAYRVFDAAGGMSTHLYVAGSDRTLYVQEALGGHGGPGPSFGPFEQLEFSPDGSLLLDYYLFRPQSGPANFLVFRSDGSIGFQSKAVANGSWNAANALLFFVWGQPGLTGELDAMIVGGQQEVIARGLNGVYWPRLSPDGGSIVYNASDTSVPDCGGVPHLWSLDVKTGRPSQLSRSISSSPFFVQRTVVWSDEQVLSPCGPGGPSSEDGVILAHDLSTGRDAAVDTAALIVPGTGGSPQSMVRTWNLLDVWFGSS